MIILVFCACGEEAALSVPETVAAMVQMSLTHARWKHRHDTPECREVPMTEFDAMGFGPTGGRLSPQVVFA